MIKIYLFPQDTLPEKILAMIDIAKIEQIGNWLNTLPPTKRGNLAYRMCNGRGYKNKPPAVVFTRREDATAFRLKFGL